MATYENKRTALPYMLHHPISYAAVLHHPISYVAELHHPKNIQVASPSATIPSVHPHTRVLGVHVLLSRCSH